MRFTVADVAVFYQLAILGAFSKIGQGSNNELIYFSKVAQITRQCLQSTVQIQKLLETKIGLNHLLRN